MSTINIKGDRPMVIISLEEYEGMKRKLFEIECLLSEKEIKDGDIAGPFTDVDSLMTHLEK
jgi:hypothetical protein